MSEKERADATDWEDEKSPCSIFMGVAVGHGSEPCGLRYFSCVTLKLNYDEKMDFQKEQMGGRAPLLFCFVG